MGHAVLPVHLKVLHGMLHLPEDHQLISAHYDPTHQMVTFGVESDAIAQVEEGQPLPHVVVQHSVENHPEHPEFRKITAKIHHEHK